MSHLSLPQKGRPIHRNDFRLFRKRRVTYGRLVLRSLEKFLMEKKKEKTSVKTPEISVRLQVRPHQEAQHAGGLRPQQPVRPSKDWRAGVRAISRFEKIIK